MVVEQNGACLTFEGGGYRKDEQTRGRACASGTFGARAFAGGLACPPLRSERVVQLPSQSQLHGDGHMAEQSGEPQVDEDVFVREQDRFLPIANIARIMKRQLPANAKVAKDAKETVQECVSEFIGFITSECGPRSGG